MSSKSKQSRPISLPYPHATRRVEVSVGCPMPRGPMVRDVCERFDLSPSSHAMDRTLTAVVPRQADGQVGLIVGPSGSGKTQIARTVFPPATACWASDPGPTALDDPRPLIEWLQTPDTETAIRLLGAVGLHSVPTWLRAISQISTGERFRAHVARGLVPMVAGGSRPGGSTALCVVDEFCSVVDVDTMRSVASCLDKAFRGGLLAGGFVGLTCRPTVETYLCPDWVLEMPDGLLRGSERSNPPRPDFRLEKASRPEWATFREHHYLSGDLSPYASCWRGVCHNEPVAFAAVLAVSGRGQGYKRRVSRLVVLPRFQGRGLGRRMMHAMGRQYASQGLLLTITTSHPAMIGCLEKGNHWRRVSRLPAGKRHEGFAKRGLKRQAIKDGRMVTTFHWAGPLASPPDDESANATA